MTLRTTSLPLVLPFSQMSVLLVTSLRLSPLTGGNTQRFAKCGHLWPSSFLSCLPLSTSHRRIVLSSNALTSSCASVGLNWTQLTSPLPFSQMSILLTSLRLSPGDRGKLATFRKLEKLPEAFQGVEAFSGRRRPQLDLVISSSAAADKLRAIWRPFHAQDCATVIIDFFSNGALRLSPGDRANAFSWRGVDEHYICVH